MIMPRAFRLVAIALTCWVIGYGACRALGQPAKGEKNLQASLLSGEKTFTSTCSGCHGLDGRGGERAPAIAGSAHVQRLSDAELANLIANGVPGTGMPAFHSLSKADVNALVGYIRSLEGGSDSRTPSGDPHRGEAIFFGKAVCSSCHTIGGKGGFIGPDLSSYGSKISAKAIRDAIVATNRIVPQGYKLATMLTVDGHTVEGIVRNEDNFSVQLLTLDGNFHFFDRSDLKKLDYADRSVMPANYGERLSRSELDDLVSYLMSLGSRGKKQQTSKTNEDDAE